MFLLGGRSEKLAKAADRLRCRDGVQTLRELGRVLGRTCGRPG